MSHVDGETPRYDRVRRGLLVAASVALVAAAVGLLLALSSALV